MNKLYFYSLLMLSITSIVKTDPFHDIWKEMEAFQEKMNSRMNEMFNEVSAIKPSKTIRNNETIGIKDGKDNVIITLTLSSDKVDVSNISTQAKDNNLEGTVSYDDKKFNFYIQDGRFFGTSWSYESSKKQDTKDTKKSEYYSFASSETSRTLPSQVDNLEDTEITTEDNKIIIKLPKSNPKRGWKKIEIRDKK